MGISISGSNAISGLSGNDTDFDKVLESLKKIESTQLNRLEAWKSDWNLRYEAFSQIIDQIQAANSMLSQLSDKNNFVTKVVQSSNDNIITAVANASAQDVQHTIKVKQLASNAIWANTGHIFESKNDIINKTGEDQYFSYIYAGERHDFKVPPNTTLDSFVNMVNNSSDNPGIKISLVQMGSGYVFQVAGNETGVKNDLYIFDSKLEGMNASGSTSNWVTNAALDPSTQLSDPNTYVFDIVLQGGAKKTFEFKGNLTADEFISQLKGQVGGIDATIDASGNLTLKGVQSITRRNTEDEAYKASSLKLEVAGGPDSKLNATGGLADGFDDDEEISISLTMEDGSVRTIAMKAGSTVRDIFTAINQTSGNGSSFSASSQNGFSIINIDGITGLAVTGTSANGAEINDTALKQKTTAATGVASKMGGALSSANLTLTFDKDKLASRLDGLADGEPGSPLTFMLIDKDGNTQQITIDGDKTYQDLLDELQKPEYNLDVTADTDADGNATLKLGDTQDFFIAVGSLGTNPAFTAKLAATTVIPAATGTDPANNLFYYDSVNDRYLLEESPDLVYTVTTNDGLTGTLSLPAGTQMKDVLKAFQNPSSASWTWVDAEGNAAAAPTDLGARFTDKDGNDVGNDPDAFTGPVYMNLANIQTVSGPQISGQISSSSNWSIQRSANAVFQVDNWPIEMESDSNKITDVLEGVVFTLQDVGEARMSISTDITSVEQSIQNFLDAVNSVLLTVNELMKYDETKEVTSSDPNDIGNSNYSPSGLTNQKGSLLTGNYGVQLFKSRFSSLLGTTPPGFKAQSVATDILSGDVLASLSSLGIKTDTDSTSDTYGLLVLAPSSSIAELQSMDKEHYTDMITNHLEAVVDFFCASGVGSSTSTDFRYGSHVEGITKAGVYDVTYTVTPDGEITDVLIGGEKAVRDESMPGNYYSVASGDPRGLSILIDDLSVGDHPPAGASPMQVRIKQGLVQTTQNFLKAELVFNDVNISANSTPEQISDAMHLKSQNGALMSLRDNYKKVMESIDVKIEREQRRIDTWYSRQKAVFANLETLLAQYSQQQKSLEGQLKQLSGNS